MKLLRGLYLIIIIGLAVVIISNLLDWILNPFYPWYDYMVGIVFCTLMIFVMSRVRKWTD